MAMMSMKQFRQMCPNIRINGKATVSRVSGAGMIHRLATSTKAERTVLSILESDAPKDSDPYRITQQVRNLFPLEGGGVYIPDFVLIHKSGSMTVIEVKGGYRGPGAEQGHERYARAASLYSCDKCRFEKWTVMNDGSILSEEWEKRHE